MTVDALLPLDTDPDFGIVEYTLLESEILDFQPFIDTPPAMLSLSPANGSQLNVDPELARFTVVTSRVRVRLGDSPLSYVVIGTMWWLIFDGTNLPTNATPIRSNGFSPFFREHSTIAKIDDTTYDLSVIPNGGWWRGSLRVEFLSGSILAPP